MESGGGGQILKLSSGGIERRKIGVSKDVELQGDFVVKRREIGSCYKVKRSRKVLLIYLSVR